MMITTPDRCSFFKRLVNIFPDLKEQINEERTSYVGFRSVTFAKEFVVPKVENLAIKKKKSLQLFKKMCELLNEFYKMVIWTFVPSLPWLF